MNAKEKYAAQVEEACRKMAQPVIDCVEELKKQGYTKEEINKWGNEATRKYGSWSETGSK